MAKKILLTSFTTWLPHQQSNSSDYLLHEISKLNYTLSSLSFLRKLPVEIELASRCVITKINVLEPDAIISCGMAERRTQLSLESNATCGDIVLKTTVALEKLMDGASRIVISHNAGKFVCEGLYYSILNYLSEQQTNSRCIFVHVPILTKENIAFIMEDFLLILKRIRYL
jgi:pyroglutamyl-peptidase